MTLKKKRPMKQKNKIGNYIREAQAKILVEKREHSVTPNVNLFIKDPLPDNFNVPFVINMVEKHIPEKLFYGVDAIYVGQFEEFSKKKVNAFFQDGTIYITNNQRDEEDMIDDIIHEVAHSVEDIFSEKIYSDLAIEREFIGKRKKLFYILKEEGYNIQLEDFLSLHYSYKFDMLLYETIGYPKLQALTMDLFLTPYSITSLKEYFATGFTQYFYGSQQQWLRQGCPYLFMKLRDLA